MGDSSKHHKDNHYNRRRHRDHDKYGHRERDNYRRREENYTEDDIANKFEFQIHTGHKQQVMALRKKEEMQAAPKISTTQAKQIIAVQKQIEQQEQISTIVETQKRKLKKQSALDRIKE